MKIFYDQIVATLPYNATELETYETWGVFLKKIMGFFELKLDFFKIAKGGKFAVECLSNDTIS